MSVNPNGSTETPDLRALLNAHKAELFSSINCHQVGTIVAFDATRQTAQVKINAQRVVYDKPQTRNGQLEQTPRLVDYPPLTDVPVFVATGGNASLRLPVAVGDTCLVLFNDRDIDAWWASGGATAPNSPRMHSLSDAMALVGFRSLANKLGNYSATDAELRFGDAVVSIKPDGTVTAAVKANGARVVLAPNGSATITGEAGQTLTLKPDGEIEALSTGDARLALKADGTAVLNNGADKFVVNPSGVVEMMNENGSQVRLAEKVRLTSASSSLLTALNAVVTAMSALNGKTGPSAATQITAAQNAINEVLE